jgi:hypothetical protein
VSVPRTQRIPTNRWLCGHHSRSERFWRKEKSLTHSRDSNRGLTSPQQGAIPTVPYRLFYRQAEVITDDLSPRINVLWRTASKIMSHKYGSNTTFIAMRQASWSSGQSF